MRTIALIALLGSLLAAAGWFALSTWQDLAEVQLSWHGYLALGLGVGLAMALGVGLMALVFYSNRRGHDELAYGMNDMRQDEPPSASVGSNHGRGETIPQGEDP
jgi:hypothetical protein